MPHFVYILQSLLNGRYYIGSCADINQRLAKHNAGATTSTRPYRPWTVVYEESFSDKSQALKREKYIKQMKSRKYIVDLIKNLGNDSACFN